MRTRKFAFEINWPLDRVVACWEFSFFKKSSITYFAVCGFRFFMEEMRSKTNNWIFPLSKIFDRKFFIVAAVPFTFYNFDARYAKGPSMSFYPDFIPILSWFYPDFILILSWFYPDFIQILSRSNQDKIWNPKLFNRKYFTCCRDTL